MQAYKDYTEDDDFEYVVTIFDGFIQIVFVVYVGDSFGENDDLFLDRKIEIELHEDLEALNSAKNSRCGIASLNSKRIRMDVYSE